MAGGHLIIALGSRVGRSVSRGPSHAGTHLSTTPFLPKVRLDSTVVARVNSAVFVISARISTSCTGFSSQGRAKLRVFPHRHRTEKHAT